MSDNKKLDLKRYNIIGLIKKYKICIIGFICFFIGFIVAPYGISETDYEKSLENIAKVESELKDSQKLIEGLKLQVEEAKVFLELDDDMKKTIKSNIDELKLKKEEELKAKKLEEERQKAEELEKKRLEEEAKEARVTGLFKDIYTLFSGSVGSAWYQGVKESVSSSGYKYDIKEPTEDDLGTIKVYDRSTGDKVTLMFYPENDIEILTLVQYDRNGKSVAVSDDLHISSSRYSIYNGTQLNASGIDEQKEFIFAE